MPITTEIRDRIAEIVFDVPPVNAFDSETWMSLPAIITAAASNPDVNCVLIRAAESARGFCGGVDIKEMQAHPARITILNRGNYLTFKAIRDAEVPVVVAAHKFVIGGGIGICGASDTIIAADETFFSLPEVDRGAMGGASHLSRMLPLHKVRAAFFTGGNIPAEEAYRLGAVERIVPRDALVAEAKAGDVRLPLEQIHSARLVLSDALIAATRPLDMSGADELIEDSQQEKADD